MAQLRENAHDVGAHDANSWYTLSREKCTLHASKSAHLRKIVRRTPKNREKVFLGATSILLSRQ